MGTRCALIDPGQRIFEGQFSNSVNTERLRTVLPNVNLDELLYTTLVQAGVDQIELGSKVDSDDHLPDFLTKRIQFGSGKEWALALMVVLSAFKDFIPNDYLKKKEYQPVLYLQFFLTSLLVTAQRRKCMVSYITFPDLEVLERLIPAPLFFPLKNLLSAMVTNTASVVTTQKLVMLKDVQIFKDLLVSKSYRQYKGDHGLLDRNEYAVRRALQSIHRSANVLESKFPTVLGRKRVTVSLLNLSAKVIDSVCGKLPGAFAESLAHFLSDWLKDEQRLVIYRMDLVGREVINSRHREYARRLLDAAKTLG